MQKKVLKILNNIFLSAKNKKALFAIEH